jgi:hypothetical protein
VALLVYLVAEQQRQLLAHAQVEDLPLGGDARRAR